MDARERFRQTRIKVRRLNEVQALIMFDCDDWKPPTVKAQHEQSDPTAARAIHNVDELAAKLEALRKEETELQDFIGVSLAIIEAVRDGFGEVYANILDWRYIDDLSWRRIHSEYGVPKSTGHYLLNIVFDWIDSVTVSRLLKGIVEI